MGPLSKMLNSQYVHQHGRHENVDQGNEFSLGNRTVTIHEVACIFGILFGSVQSIPGRHSEHMATHDRSFHTLSPEALLSFLRTQDGIKGKQV